MNIVLTYSKQHFDPNGLEQLESLRHTSASLLARTAYRELRRFGDVTYIEAGRPDLWPKDVNCDLLVGIEPNFDTAVRHFRPDRSLLLAVNQHPASRRDRLTKIMQAYGAPVAALSGADGTTGRTQATDCADRILLVGNWRTAESYWHSGEPNQKVFATTYGFDRATNAGNDDKRRTEIATRERLNVLLHLGTIGARKGGFLLGPLCETLIEEGMGRRLVVTGRPANDYWASQLEALAAKYPGTLSLPGWMDPRSQGFADLLSSSLFGVLPSAEEGLPGSAIDLLSASVPVLATRDSGLILPADWVVPDAEHTSQVVEFIAGAIQSHSGDKEGQSRRAAELHSTFYANTHVYSRGIRRFVQEGEVWPGLSLTLAIHNKEKTISAVARSVNRALDGYTNATLNVVYDGCSDNSESEVSKEIQGAEYSVTTSYLDDVFEVLSNNYGMSISPAEVNGVIQDDNVLLRPSSLREGVMLLASAEQLACVGLLAGVNIYPIGTDCGWPGTGQHVSTRDEHYWRQDSASLDAFDRTYLEVDAVMRGPILFSSLAQSSIGLLDERFAPLYNDDMAWCLKARAHGFRILAFDGRVLNRSESMGSPTPQQSAIYAEAFERNTKLLVSEAIYPVRANYLVLHRDSDGQANRQSRAAQILRDRYQRVLLYRLAREKLLGLLPARFRTRASATKTALKRLLSR